MKRKRSILLIKPQSDESEDSDENIEKEIEKDNNSEKEEKEKVEMNCEVEDNEKSDDTTSNKTNEEPEVLEKKQKKRKPGIIYISSIPKHMNVTLIREYLSPFGDIGRVFLQPDKKFREYLCQSIKNV